MEDNPPVITLFHNSHGPGITEHDGTSSRTVIVQQMVSIIFQEERFFSRSSRFSMGQKLPFQSPPCQKRDSFQLPD